MDLNLTGKRALVTGASSGIGQAIAQRLAAEGAKVVVHGRNKERSEAAAASITDAGGAAKVVLGDLADEGQTERVVRESLEAFDGLDIVVNNAGTTGAQDWTATADDWADNYNKNVLSMVRVIRGTIDSVKSRGWGRYIQISSALGASPVATYPDYNATKGAVNNLSVSLSKSLAGTGVTANTISPGPVRTPLFEGFVTSFAERLGITADTFDELEREVVQQVLPNVIAGRAGRPEEIADAVAFLASPLADFITGTNLRVDGGFVAAVN